jgi:hypothetical protein
LRVPLGWLRAWLSQGQLQPPNPAYSTFPDPELSLAGWI